MTKMKRFMLLLAAMTMSIGAFAQFQEGKGYVGASMTGFDLHYNGENGLNIGLQAKAGYFPLDNLMVYATIDAQHNGSETVADHIGFGAGGRYYITQNGLYLGGGLKFIHAYHSYNDLMPGVEVGYAYYINRSVTVEPAIYYDQSLKKYDYSNIGLKIGLGIYLFDD